MFFNGMPTHLNLGGVRFHLISGGISRGGEKEKGEGDEEDVGFLLNQPWLILNFKFDELCYFGCMFLWREQKLDC